MRRYSNAITAYEDMYAVILSECGIKFLRQEVICLECGYHSPTIRICCPTCKDPHPDVAVVDFLIPPNTVIEIGGDYINKRKLRLKDMRRTKALNTMGYSVIRVANNEVVELWNNSQKRHPISGQK